GSGLIVSRDGFAVTNVHVVQGASRITVAIPDGVYEADLYADSSEGRVRGDIALLKLRGRSKFPFVDWRKGDSDRLEPGSFVLAMGNPFGHGADGQCAATWGIVSGKARAASERGYLYINALQTDAEINPGNSGGPLFDGRFIGINGLMASRQGRFNSGVGFAIPVNQVKLFLRRLLKEEGGSVSYGYHGLHVETAPGETGARVRAAEGGSPAADRGVRAGDVIIKAKGKRIRNRTDFINVVGRLPEGSLVTLTLLRRRNARVVRFRLAASPPRRGPKGGDPLKGLPLPERGFLGAEYEPTAEGLRLTRIVAGAAAEAAGLRVGDVLQKLDRQRVGTPTELAGMLQHLPRGAAVRVAYLRDGAKGERRLTLCSLAEAAGVAR
ncbi:MAG: trypsin-like peptidase domain-containing protein, partial [Planctomycetota bacterium]